MVVHYGTTTFPALEEASNRLELANCNVLGYAVNEISSRHGSSYYSSDKYQDKYQYEYRYAEDTQRPEKKPENDREKEGSTC